MAQKIPNPDTVAWLIGGFYNFHPGDTAIFGDSQPLGIADEIKIWIGSGAKKDYYDKILFRYTKVKTPSGAAQVLFTWNNYWSEVTNAIANGQDPESIEKPPGSIPTNLEELTYDLREKQKQSSEAQKRGELSDFDYLTAFEQRLEEMRLDTPEVQKETAEQFLYIRDNSPDTTIQLSEGQAADLLNQIELAENDPKSFLSAFWEKISDPNKLAEASKEFVKKTHASWILQNKFKETGLSAGHSALRMLSDIGAQLNIKAPRSQKIKGLQNIKHPDMASIFNDLAHPDNKRALERYLKDTGRANELEKEMGTLALGMSNLFALQQAYMEMAGNETLAAMYRFTAFSTPETEPPRYEIVDSPSQATYQINLGDISRIAQDVTGFDVRSFAIESLSNRFPIVGEIASKFGLISTEVTSAAGATAAETAALATAATGAVEATAAATTTVAAGAATAGTVTLAGVEVSLASLPTGVTQVVAVVIAVGAALWKILKKISPRLSSYLSRLFSNLKKEGKLLPFVIGVTGVTIGVVVASPVIILAGGLFLVGALAGGASVATASITGFVGSVFGAIFLGLWVVAINPLVKAMLVIGGGLILFTTLVYFILQAGAYMVPPSETGWAGVPGLPPGFGGLPGGGNITSPYIDIQKTGVSANPPQGPSDNLRYENNALDIPLRVTFTVTIVAKKSTLSNITISLECIKIDSTGFYQQGTCPAVENWSDNNPRDNPPETISPQNPYTFSYDAIYTGDQWKDSISIDVWTIQAEAENITTIASDSATVIIGSPPASDCPILGGSVNTSSYQGAPEIGHGSNTYWSSDDTSSVADCGFAIPGLSGCYGPTQSADIGNGGDVNNVCNTQASLCSYYGYAADIDSPGGTAVYLPAIYGQSFDWNLVGTYGVPSTNNPAWGHGLIYTTTNGEYTIYLAHLESPNAPTSGVSGTKVGELKSGPDHLHIELKIGNAYVIPDFLCGGAGP